MKVEPYKGYLHDCLLGQMTEVGAPPYTHAHHQAGGAREQRADVPPPLLSCQDLGPGQPPVLPALLEAAERGWGLLPRPSNDHA